VSGPRSAITNGLDTYTFPGIWPEEVVFLDPYPEVPIPESIWHIRDQLIGELALAQPDLFERRSGCVLIGPDRGYGGHSQTDVAEAFAMALDQVPEHEVLYGAMLGVAGVRAKTKSGMPNFASFHRALPRFVDDAKFSIVQPNIKQHRVIPLHALVPAYAGNTDLPRFTGTTLTQCQIEAIRYTALSVRDCEYVAHLRLAGLKTGTHYYLTGSGSGLGGPSIALNPAGPYHDLDIIATNDELEPDEISAAFKVISEAFYGPLEEERKVVRIAESSKLLEGSVYCSPASQISIDFFPGKRLQDVLVRPEYLAQGLIHQLS